MVVEVRLFGPFLHPSTEVAGQVMIFLALQHVKSISVGNSAGVKLTACRVPRHIDIYIYIYITPLNIRVVRMVPYYHMVPA